MPPFARSPLCKTFALASFAALLSGCPPRLPPDNPLPAKARSWCELLNSQLPEGEVDCFATPGLLAAGNFGREKNPLERTFDACFDNHPETLKTILREEPAGTITIAEAVKTQVGAQATVNLTSLVSWLPQGSLKATTDSSVVVSVTLKDAKWRYVSNLPQAFRTRLADPELTPIQKQNLEDCQAYLCENAAEGPEQHVYVYKSLVATPVIQFRSQKGTNLGVELNFAGGGDDPSSTSTPLGQVKVGLERAKEGLVEIVYETPLILAGGLDVSAPVMGSVCSQSAKACGPDEPQNTVREKVICGLRGGIVEALALNKSVLDVISNPSEYALGKEKEAKLDYLKKKRDELAAYTEASERHLTQCYDASQDCTSALLLPLPPLELPKLLSATALRTLGEALMAYPYEMGWGGGNCENKDPDHATCWTRIFNVVVVDDQVTMKYQHKNGFIKGALSGNVLKGSWGQDGSNGGSILLKFSDDFQKAVGWWNESNYLAMRRVTPK